MKKLIAGILVKILRKLLILTNEADYGVLRKSDQASQVLLQLYYKDLLSRRKKLPSFDEVGFREYSQTNEDGILLFIFSVIGSGNKKCIEIGAQKGIECNTANLIINHAWQGLLLDTNSQAVEVGQMFYRLNFNTKGFAPVFINKKVTRKNINTIIQQGGFNGEIDLLSLDIDGVDYWVLEALSVVRPRVIVVEYNNNIPPDKSWTIPYSNSFDIRNDIHNKKDKIFYGASLLAFVKLAKKKGYRLIGCNWRNFNAFFMRKDIAKRAFPEVAVGDCFYNSLALENLSKRRGEVDKLPWVEV